MSEKMRYIPTLQEYARKRKKASMKFCDPQSCMECEFYRSSFNICVWGENIKHVENLSCCPVTNRVM